MRTIVVTVGTSLLANARRNGPANPSDAVLVEALRTDPVRASAESHTLYRLGLDRQDKLVFLHTDTNEGYRCARCFTEHYRSLVQEARREKIPDLSYNISTFASRGLRALARALAAVSIAARREGREPVFCSTGGFKPETALAAICGQLLGVEVWYVYETFSELVRFPPLPIGWDLRLVGRSDVQEFLTWLKADLRRIEEARSRVQALGEDMGALVEQDEGYLVLSPLGELLHEVLSQGHVAPACDWPEPYDAPPEEKVRIGEDHHNPRGTESQCDRLARSRYVVSVRTGSLEDSAHTRVASVDERGRITFLYSDGSKAINLHVATTARGLQQTELLAGYFFRECFRER